MCFKFLVCVFKIFGGWVSSRFLGLSAGPPLRWTTLPLDIPKISRFFSVSPHNFHSFFSLLEVFSLNFGGVFEDRGAQMCTLGLSGYRVDPVGERKKSAKFWAPTLPFGPIFSEFGPPPLRAPTPSGPNQKQNWPNAVWPNSVNKNWPNLAK